MASSKFCLNIAGDTPSSNRLFDAIASHCVPVIISDEIELPFEDVLDYTEFSVFVLAAKAVKKGYLLNLLRGIKQEEWTKMWERLKEIGGHYEYQYPSQPNDVVDMIWQTISRKKMPMRPLRGSRRLPQAAAASLNDLAVKHPDGYIEIKDRSKDIIISGGENISSVEVENILYQHPAIFEVSVVARPDERWGDSPCAFVTPKPGVDASGLADDIMKFSRAKMPAYWVPKSVVFGPLPKTATGKIQKHLLRRQAKLAEKPTAPEKDVPPQPEPEPEKVATPTEIEGLLVEDKLQLTLSKMATRKMKEREMDFFEGDCFYCYCYKERKK
ncbi:uncharacterized protein LOC131025600 [Salvia miltiorrhiza]|uniref:uncharacterized protein LOC131025600 n=1 Tax=Salvia miltiorrhiza TaxID=226208 RepID=UPI0025AD8938|nr:uncharacterized protein LOC131025600 [Salvia miltiorrhiza]